MIEGPSVIRTVLIVTDEPEKVTQAVLQRLGIGVTSWSGKGVPSKTEHTTLVLRFKSTGSKKFNDNCKWRRPQVLHVIMQGHHAMGGKLRQALRYK